MSRPIRDEEGFLIVQLYNDGLAFSEIGQAVGRSRQGVQQYLVRIGVHESVSREAKQTAVESAIRWYCRGATIKHAAACYRLDPRTLARHLRKRGIPTPRQPINREE